MKRNLLGAFIVTLSWIILSCGSPSEEKAKSPVSSTPTDIKKFVEAKCTMCHFTDRIYKDKRYPIEWMNIVKRMRLKNPQWISEEDADKILDYLIKNTSKSE